jgi:nucleoside-diphosphate-sugar epimerase
LTVKILVTGGSGYLGTHIRQHFGADDLSRRSGLDLLNLQDVQIARDYDVVIHLAACLDKSPDSAEEVFLTNVEGTINLLRVMRADTVFIFASAKDVYGRFADNYPEVPEDCPTLYSGQTALEWSKLIAERYIEYYAHRTGFRSCIFRLSNVYAPATEGNLPGIVGHYAEMVAAGKPIALPAGGRPRRDLMHVDDLAAACELFIESVLRHGLYNLGGGRQNALTLRDLLDTLGRITGKEPVIDNSVSIPDPVPMNYVSDISRVGHELDWEPQIGVEEGLATLFDAQQPDNGEAP